MLSNPIVALWGSPSYLSSYLGPHCFSQPDCKKIICSLSPLALFTVSMRNWFGFLSCWRVRPKKGGAVLGVEYKTWVLTEIEISWIAVSSVTCMNNTAVGFQILSLPVHSLPACQPKEYGGPTGQLWGHSNEFFGVSRDKIASNQSNTEKTVQGDHDGTGT